MSDIQRWAIPYGYCGGRAGDDSPVAMVTYADHLAAIQQAEQRVTKRLVKQHTALMSIDLEKARLLGQRDALAAAVQRVQDFFRTDEGQPSFAVVNGVIAAIKGDSDERS